MVSFNKLVCIELVRDENKSVSVNDKKSILRKEPYIYDVLTEGEMAWDSLNLSPLNNKNIVPICR